MNSKLRRIAAHYLFDGERFVRFPLVDVERESGRIVSVRTTESVEVDAMEGVEFYSGILAPGFCNAHCHLELSYLLFQIPEGGGYAAFADAMARVRNNFSREQIVEAMVEADRRMWEEGVSVVGDVANSDLSFEVKQHSPIAYHTFAEVFGLRQNNFDEAQQLATLGNTSLTPHSIYSVQDREFRKICSTKQESPLSIHFLESEAEKALFEGHGPLHDWYQRVGFECDFLHHLSPARRLCDMTPAEQSVLLVHNCCVTTEDIDMILNHFTAPVYWALCSRSNRYISSIEASSYHLLREHGANICIGTDSLASNHSLSVIDELKCFNDVPLETLLRWATSVPAEALGFGESMGRIVEGATPGIVLIEDVDFNTLSLRPTTTTRRLV